MKQRLFSCLFNFSFFVSLVFPLSSWTQEAAESLTIKDRQPQSLVAKEGWHPTLNLGANLSLGSSSNVVGQPDGDSRTYGANLDGGINYKREQHELQNSLKIKGATTKTPVLPRFVKSSDEVNFTSTYLYSLEAYPWVGPYARVNAKTALFYGEDVRGEVVTYEKRTRAGAVQDTITGDSLRLTDGLKPLTVKESVGAFAKLIEQEKRKFIARLGVGALQVDAAGQYLVKDNETTAGVIEVEQLDSYSQHGIEGGFTFEGLIDEKTKYALTFDFLTPISPDLPATDKRDDFELTNIDLNFKLTTKVVEWMNFNYDYSFKREPQLLDENQEQHMLSISFAYTLL
jgi:hypothetical protein